MEKPFEIGELVCWDGGVDELGVILEQKYIKPRYYYRVLWQETGLKKMHTATFLRKAGEKENEKEDKSR